MYVVDCLTHVYGVCVFFFFFFFQAEDGIRDGHVTGVQTCALPISLIPRAIPTGSWPSSHADQRPATKGPTTAGMPAGPDVTAASNTTGPSSGPHLTYADPSVTHSNATSRPAAPTRSTHPAPPFRQPRGQAT